MIHPSFRMVAIGDPLREGGKPWLTEEITSMFHIHRYVAGLSHTIRCVWAVSCCCDGAVAVL